MNSQKQLFSEPISDMKTLIKIHKMTAEEIKNRGEKLSINYSTAETPFGKVLLASTPKGICHAAFFDNKSEAIADLRYRFPNAKYTESENNAHKEAIELFNLDENKTQRLEDDRDVRIQVHISGTPFQFKVWEALLEIPMGHLSTYGAIANQIDKPGASRAVGSAVGKNPIAFLIPCHRVVQATGKIGGYMWGADRKYAIIAQEAAHTNGA